MPDVCHLKAQGTSCRQALFRSRHSIAALSRKNLELTAKLKQVSWWCLYASRGGWPLRIATHAASGLRLQPCVVAAQVEASCLYRQGSGSEDLRCKLLEIFKPGCQHTAALWTFQLIILPGRGPEVASVPRSNMSRTSMQRASSDQQHL